MTAPFICSVLIVISLFLLHQEAEPLSELKYNELLASIEESESIKGLKVVSKHLLTNELKIIYTVRDTIMSYIEIMFVVLALNLLSIIYTAKKIKHDF